MKKRFIFVVIMLPFVGLYAYFVSCKRYGRSFNDTRLTLGIPIIEDNFKHSDDYSTWYEEREIFPRHAMKSISTNWLGIHIEQDNFQFIKDSAVVTMYCYYHYKEKCYNIYLGVDGYEKISCAMAQKILSEQGLSVKMNCQACAIKE